MRPWPSYDTEPRDGRWAATARLVSRLRGGGRRRLIATGVTGALIFSMMMTVGVTSAPAYARTRLHYAAASSALVTLNGVSCVDATHCVAVGSTSSRTAAIEATTDGSTWITQTVPAGVGFLSSVSCVDATHCTAVGDGIVATTNGSTWLPESAPGGFLDSVACTDATHCIAVGGLDWVSTTDGSNWVVQFATAPSSFYTFNGVSCVSSSDCLVVGEHAGSSYLVSGTSIGGSGGGTATTAVSGSLNSGVCSDEIHCFAVGSSSGGGTILSVTNGVSFDNETAPSGVSVLNSVSCADSTPCFAVGSTSNGEAAIVATTDGSTWVSQALPPGLTALNGVSCVSISHCTAVGTYAGGAVIVTTIDGSTWQDQLPATPTITKVRPGYGPAAGGSRVVIDGTALTGLTTVDFGSSPAASFHVAKGGTKVIAYSSPGAGTVNITVTGPLSPSAVTPADQFRYGPSVTTLKPTSGPVGKTVNIVGTNFTDSTTVLFGSTSATFTVASKTKIVATAPNHSLGTVQITVTNAGGTSPLTPADQYTYVAPR
jgi:hypothetical protein